MDTKQIQDMYLAYLSEEGLKGSVDEDGDIRFKYEGLFYYIFLESEDVFYIKLPRLWDIESEEELVKALKAANDVSQQYKVGRISITELGDKKTTDMDVFSFLKKPDDFREFFQKMLDVLQQMAEEFWKEMKK